MSHCAAPIRPFLIGSAAVAEATAMTPAMPTTEETMSSDDQIGDAWKQHRPYLIDLAFRMLGDIGAAEDAVQEAFFRLVQTPLVSVDDARGWLIGVTSRLCLDHIKSAHWRRERAQDMTARDYRDNGAAAVN